MAEGAANDPGRSRRGLSVGVLVAIAVAVGVGVSVSRRSDDGNVRTGDSTVASSASLPPSLTVSTVVSTSAPASSQAPASSPAPAPTTTLPAPPSHPAMPEVDLSKIGTAQPEECQPQLLTATTAVSAPTVAAVPAPTVVVGAGPEGTVMTTIPFASPDDQSTLVAAVTAYGCAHLDTFSGVRVSGVVVEISFTSDVAARQAALDQQLGAGRVRAVVGDVLLATRAKVREDLMALFDQRDRNGNSPIVGLGDDSYRMDVELAATQSKRADTLAAMYGKAVDITVGLLHWSINGPVASGPIVCQATGGPRAGGRGQVSGVAVTVEPITSVRSGEQFTGNVTIRNDTTAPIEIHADSGFLVAPVHAVGGSSPIAVFEGSINAMLHMPTPIAPGASAAFDLRGGTASCDPSLGYALAPGDYEVVIPVPIGVDGNTTIVDVRAPLKIIG